MKIFDKIQDHDHDQETLEKVKLAGKENQASKSLETNLVLCYDFAVYRNLFFKSS